MKILTDETFLGVAGVILGVLGIALAFVFYYRGKRSKDPRWQIKTMTLIQAYRSRVQELQVTFREETVENLSVTLLSFWNAGADSINGQDIAKSNPLKIVAKGQAKILGAKLIAATSEHSNIGVITDAERRSSHIHFDFLDKNDGGMFQVVHTGTSSDDIGIEGKIKGVNHYQLQRRPVMLYAGSPFVAAFKVIRRQQLVEVTSMILVAVGISFASAQLVFGEENDTSSREISIHLGWGTLIPLGIGVFIGGIVPLAALAYDIWRARAPKGIDVYQATDDA